MLTGQEQERRAAAKPLYILESIPDPICGVGIWAWGSGAQLVDL
jgi:hypothetical protein